MPDSGIALQLGVINIRWYGVLICSGMILAFFWANHMTKKNGLSPDHLINIFLWIVPLGILGARLYYVIFNWSWYSAHPGEILRTWEGGLAIHGGVITGILVLLVYSHSHRQSFRRWGDILTPGLVLAQGIGRWGNFFNQEAYGYETNVPWAMYIDGAWRHPTFLYESIWDITGFMILAICSRKKKGKTGDILAWYFIWYSAGRFIIERFRTDSLMFGNLRAAMLVSVAGVLLGLGLLWYNRKKPALPVKPDKPVKPIKTIKR